jgi:plasmid maintenance system antidote protein VapI
MNFEKLESDLLILLDSQLIKKKSINPNYSMRALARDIGICPTLLFRFTKRERKLTPLFAYKLASYFNFEKDQLLNVLVTTITKDEASLT